MRKEYRLYNIIFPFWALVWTPSVYWLLLIPVNYLIDRWVLRSSLADDENKDIFCRRNTWKICLTGFLCDFAGSLFLFASSWIIGAFLENHYRPEYEISGRFIESSMYNPFGDPLALLLTVIAVILTAFLIFLFDRLILEEAGLEAARAKYAARRLAVFTAPYIFLFPSGLLLHYLM